MVILIDRYEIKVPEFTSMVVNDSGKKEDFDRSKALSKLGPKLRLIVDFDVTHSGTIVNGRVYPGKEIRKAIPTWTHPYKKAYLKQHPSSGLFASGDEPSVLGRVLGGRYIQLKDDLDNDWINPPLRDQGSGYIVCPVEVSDKDAVEQIIDERILTVSVGMMPDKIICPFCLTDWVPSMNSTGEPPEKCEHRPKNAYKMDGVKGLMPFYFVARGIVYDHIANAFRPAQPYASVLGIKAIEDNAKDYGFEGETTAGALGQLALCDAEGHIVQFGDSLEDKATISPPLTEADAVVLACMDTAGCLAMIGDFSDGISAAQIKAAISRANGKTGGIQRIGQRGALPVGNSELVASSIRFLDRYTGVDRDVVGFKLLATKVPQITKQEEKGMTWEEVKALSDQIFEKIKDLPDDAETCTDALKTCLGDLFDKVNEKVAVDPMDEADAELEGLAAGLIPQDKKLTSAERKKLPDSAFCGPDRSFPAHDAPHVRNGLARLKQSSFPPATKSKILACLRKRAKKHGVEVSKDCEAVAEKAPITDASNTEPNTNQLKKLLSDAEGRENLVKVELAAIKAERDSYATQIHNDLVDRLFDRRIQLKKPDVQNLTPENVAEYKKRLSERSNSSLNDSLADLSVETVVVDPVAISKSPVLGTKNQAGDLDASKTNKGTDKKLTNREKFMRFGKTKES